MIMFMLALKCFLLVCFVVTESTLPFVFIILAAVFSPLDIVFNLPDSYLYGYDLFFRPCLF